MKKSFTQCLLLFVCFAIFVSVSGCGSNLFVDLDEDQTSAVVTEAANVKSDTQARALISDLEDLMKDADSTSEYENLQKAAQNLIDNPNVSSGVKNDARLVLAQANMGVLDITPLDVAADILEATTSQNITGESFVANLGLSDKVTTSTARELVNYFDLVPESKFTSGNYLQKAVAGTVLVVKAIDAVYDLETETFVGTPSNSLLQLVSEDTYGKSILTYTVEAIEAFDKSGVFDLTGNSDSNDLSDGLDTFELAIEEMNELNTAVQNGEVYTYNAINYDFSDLHANHDDDIENAFAAILRGDENED